MCFLPAYGPAPIANIIRKSASIMAIAIPLKKIVSVPRLVFSFMKPSMAQIKPVRDKITDPTNSTREPGESVNIL